MNTKAQYDKVSVRSSKNITKNYSTSFSFGIFCLHKKLHNPIYSIYGFVRLADEIVDTFHDFNQLELFKRFKEDTYAAIAHKISLNPVLNAFQEVVNTYGIENELIESFLYSMERDLSVKAHDKESFDTYVYGSAESVGLMCLRVFVTGDSSKYEALKPFAKKLGAAFQKVNFLRDFKDDAENLGRNYFPGVNFTALDEVSRKFIESDIENDFKIAHQGIKMLPSEAQFGVYVAYIYYKKLFQKIRSKNTHEILESRIRVPNSEKLSLLLLSWFRHKFDMI